MKRLYVLLLLLATATAYAQNAKEAEENIVFFYNAALTDGKYITCNGFDMDFHVNTYQILQDNGIIDSMFVSTNEKQLAEIDRKDWIYKCKFNVTKQQLKHPLAYLNIQNLDGNCTIYINKKKVNYYNNSFLEYNEDVRKYLKKGKNTIELHFVPKDSVRMKQRSPQYLYGWDWYPQTLAPHIGAIWLSFENDAPYIDYANIQTEDITYNDDGMADGEMILNIHFRKPLEGNHKIILDNGVINHDYTAKINGPLYFDVPKQESCYYTFRFTLKDTPLWYPNGTGKQYLYKFNICLDDTNNVLYSTQTGVRKIQLVQDKDAFGESFYFKVNNQNVFAKGANYIMTYKSSAFDIGLAAAANMNMLRIWGGSDYGSDEFYSFCDMYGIMVWQDFSFSTELYPVNEEFISDVQREASQNLMRISGHPSLALLCGNNEIWEGWNHWGWKEQVSDTLQAVKDYDYLFREVLQTVSDEYTPTIKYIHSSPVYHGWGSERSRTHGDSHYYGVWWADSNFETYTHKIPRFMSEYGFQGAMNPETAEQYCTSPYTKDNEAFAIHQKHPRGFELIDNRLKEWYGNYVNDDQYIAFSQMTQQEGMKIAMEAHRQNKPYCMGSLFWQFNEPYPCVGWGCIDYSGMPKPVYYTAQKAFAPVIFTIDKDNSDTVKIYACSDLPDDTLLTYRIRIMNQEDSIHYVYIGEKTLVKANETKLLASIAYKDMKNFNKIKDYLFVDGFYGDEFICNYAFFCYPKDYISFDKYMEVVFDEYYFSEEER